MAVPLRPRLHAGPAGRASALPRSRTRRTQMGFAPSSPFPTLPTRVELLIPSVHTAASGQLSSACSLCRELMLLSGGANGHPGLGAAAAPPGRGPSEGPGTASRGGLLVGHTPGAWDGSRWDTKQWQNSDATGRLGNHSKAGSAHPSPKRTKLNTHYPKPKLSGLPLHHPKEKLKSRQRTSEERILQGVHLGGRAVWSGRSPSSARAPGLARTSPHSGPASSAVGCGEKTHFARCCDRRVKRLSQCPAPRRCSVLVRRVLCVSDQVL